MNILALSGGGVQGLFTNVVLERLEAREGPLVETLDVVAGTSIGGALAAAIAWGLPMTQVRAQFRKAAPAIFPSLNGTMPELDRAWSSARGVMTARYKVGPWRDLLDGLFGDARMGDARCDLLIPAIVLETAQLRVFSNKTDPKMLVRDAILASSAAPTFFPPYKVGDDWYIDGGMAANAPELIALSYVPDAVTRAVVGSIGTASSNPRIQVDKHPDWGLAQWGRRERLARLSMAVTQNAPVALTRQLLGERYWRIDLEPDAATARHLALDGASICALEALERLGGDAVLDNSWFWPKKKAPVCAQDVLERKEAMKIA